MCNGTPFVGGCGSRPLPKLGQGGTDPHPLEGARDRSSPVRPAGGDGCCPVSSPPARPAALAGQDLVLPALWGPAQPR